MLESVSSLYPFFYGRVLHPLYHLLKRDGFIAADRKALATDKLDAAGLTELQRIKFSRLLRGARTRSPYYRETIDTGAAEAALEGVPPHALGLPVLTRETLVERMHALADPAIARDLIVADGTRRSRFGSGIRSAFRSESVWHCFAPRWQRRGRRPPSWAASAPIRHVTVCLIHPI